eukprot:XP_025012775.1 proline-rich receptor-like protein kinase PERK2 [Ricinus communis]
MTPTNNYDDNLFLYFSLPPPYSPPKWPPSQKPPPSPKVAPPHNTPPNHPFQPPPPHNTPHPPPQNPTLPPPSPLPKPVTPPNHPSQPPPSPRVAPPPPQPVPVPGTPPPHPFHPPPAPPVHPIFPPPPPPTPTPGHNSTVIVVVFVSLGGLFFLAFLSVALCCFIKKRKKKNIQKTEIIDFDEHMKVQETIVPGPHGEQMKVLTIEEDIHINEKIKKNENRSKDFLHDHSLHISDKEASSSHCDHHLEHKV